MEEVEETNKTTTVAPQSTRLRENYHRHDHHYHYHYHSHHHHFRPPRPLYNNHYRHTFYYGPNGYQINGFFDQNYQHHYQQQQSYPALLPLPPILPFRPAFHHQSQRFKSKIHKKPSSQPLALPTCSNVDSEVPSCTILRDGEGFQQQAISHIKRFNGDTTTSTLVAAKRPDSGGIEGQVISILANHFRVKFDPSQKIFHYDLSISPNPSKELARVIKKKLVEENLAILSHACPAFDGRKNLYSPIQFQSDKLEFFVSLPITTSNKATSDPNNPVEVENKTKLFRVNVKLVSKLDGNELNRYLKKEGDDWVPLPQEYLHALDVVLRENPNEQCIPLGRSFYSTSMGGSKEIGEGAIGLRGFFQSLRPTQQGLTLNVDFSVTAFHESIGVIPYLQLRLKFLHDLPKRRDRNLSMDERREVEKELKNLRVFVSHRDTVQRYRFHSLTEEVTENLGFSYRDGTKVRLVDYFKDQYGVDIKYRGLPCIQISRSKPCYLPMEVCMICEGQKFLGKLSDDQTAKIMKMGIQGPKERRAIINGVINGSVGPTSGKQGEEFKLQVSKEMTRLNGRILRPPKLKLGDDGLVKDVVPTRNDRQWNILGGHVVEGTRIERWALISFGGTQCQKSNIPKFINQLHSRCKQLGIFLQNPAIINPQFEPMHVLSNVTLLENKLNKIRRAASNNLDLLLCLMEKKHKGYADFKRIAETRVGVVTQCCLYSNLEKLNSQFLSNLALKINAKVGGSTVTLFNSLPTQIPRLLGPDEPIILMGADVTHPHPLDDNSPSVAAVVGSINWPSVNRYVSRMRSQTHRQEIIEELGEMVGEILSEFQLQVHHLPGRIIFFRDGVSETQFYKVLKEELQSIRLACGNFPNYKPLITFAVVQKRHHTRLFPDENDPNLAQFHNENVPPGTVVDTVITHPREFDFYLCSHWGVKGTSRPTHYHVLWDENEFTSDEFQKLVYCLCFTFVRCTKPISIVPPAYYAHLAAYRGRLYLERDESVGSIRDCASKMSRAGPPKAIPLPKISENVRKLMFYC